MTTTKKSKNTLYIVASIFGGLSFISMIPFVIYAVMEGNVLPAMSTFLLYLVSLGIQVITKPSGLREPMGQ